MQTRPEPSSLASRQARPAAARVLDRRGDIAARGRLVTVEVARISGRPTTAAAPETLQAPAAPGRWHAVESAWRDEMRRLSEVEPATG